MSSVACGSSILGIHWLLQHSANTVLDCAYSWYYGVKVATLIRTWWSTRVVLPSMLAVFAGCDAPRAVFPSNVALADEARGDSTGAVLVPGVLPVVIASGAFDQTPKKTVEIPQLPFFDKVVHISCRGPCWWTQWSTSLLCRSCSFPGGLKFTDSLVTCPLLSTTGARAGRRRGRFPWSSYSEDHGDSAVAIFFLVVDALVVPGLAC